MNRVGSWVYSKVVLPLKEVVTSGITPHSLAFSFAVGFQGGVFPIPGAGCVVTALINMIFGVKRVNPVVCQVANLIATPINLATITTYIMMGETLLGRTPSGITVESLVEGLNKEFWKTLVLFQVGILCAIFSWA
jgi:uncharacterized protein (DUF2062 family)